MTMYHLTSNQRQSIADILNSAESARERDWWLPHCDSFFKRRTGTAGQAREICVIEHDLGLIGVDLAGKSVLDAGTGCGFYAFVFALLGAVRVVGIDVWRESIDLANGFHKDILGGNLPVSFTIQDAGRLGFEDASFDIVVCREAISHIHDTQEFIREAARVLKKGGKLLISEGHNGANLLQRRAAWAIWDRAENGPPSEDFHGHKIVEPMVELRRNILRRNFKTMAEARVDAIALGTFQMNESQIIDAGAKFLATGEMPDSRYARGKCPVVPDTGMYCERLLDPRELARTMRGVGLVPRISAHYGLGTNPIRSVVFRSLEALSPLSIYLARGYKIVATKSFGEGGRGFRRALYHRREAAREDPRPPGTSPRSKRSEDR